MPWIVYNWFRTIVCSQISFYKHLLLEDISDNKLLDLLNILQFYLFTFNADDLAVINHEVLQKSANKMILTNKEMFCSHSKKLWWSVMLLSIH